jgi:hypothetical protein
MPVVLTPHSRRNRNLIFLVLELDLVLPGLAACDAVPEYEFEDEIEGDYSR